MRPVGVPEMLAKLFRRGMSCEDVLAVLQTYLDGETNGETARTVLEHLDNCEICDRESDVYRRIKGSLAAQAPEADPEIMAALTRFSSRIVQGDIS